MNLQANIPNTLPDAAMRQPVMAELKEQGIATTFHYVPLHDSEGGRRFARRATECPVTVDVSTRLVRLPFFNTLAPSEVDRVAEAFVRAVERAS